MDGDDVKSAQNLLKKNSSYNGPVNGEFDQLTAQGATAAKLAMPPRQRAGSAPRKSAERVTMGSRPCAVAPPSLPVNAMAIAIWLGYTTPKQAFGTNLEKLLLGKAQPAADAKKRIAERKKQAAATPLREKALTQMRKFVGLTENPAGTGAKATPSNATDVML
jgi:hypothetical protein